MMRGQWILPAYALLHNYAKELNLMKTYIKPKLILFFLIAAFIILAAFEHNTAPLPSLMYITGSAVSTHEYEEDKLGKEIPLPKNESIAAYTYNAVKNTLCVISHTKNTYRLYSLEVDDCWSRPRQWKVSPGEELLHFAYDPDGNLYACRKSRHGKKISQSLVRLHNNGRITKIMLKDLEKVPKTSDTGISHDITDIRFSGTALAITYRNHAVKFYNIAEGQALGADSVTGTAGQNIFYDLHYLSPGTRAHSNTLRLTYYDIRTGEKEYACNIVSTSRRAIWLANYREKVYLLTSDGLFTGNCSEAAFTKKLSFSLPAGIHILSLQAARDDIIYFAWMDGSGSPHLTKLNFLKLDSLSSV